MKKNDKLINQTNILLYVLIFVVIVFIALLLIPKENEIIFKVKSEKEAEVVEKDLSMSLLDVKRDLQELENLV